MSTTFVVPQTEFEIIDNSAFEPPVKPEIVKPVYLCAFASDKGEEKMQLVYGDFESRYGDNISYEKYGQPLLQAALASNEGAVVLAKRVVAEDSTLGNAYIMVSVKASELINKTDANGKTIYVDKKGNETLAENDSEGQPNTPVQYKKAILKFSVESLEGKKNMDEISLEVEDKIVENSDGGESKYPLFLLTDNGRGKSIKKFKITPNYIDSKYKNYIEYDLNIMENNKVIETLPFSMDIDVVEARINRSIDSIVRHFSSQIKAKIYPDSINKFIAKISEITGLTREGVLYEDLLFGKNKKGTDVGNYISVPALIPTEEYDPNESNVGNLSYPFGMDFANGTNGAFGEKPLITSRYDEQLEKFFGGEFSDDIYDLDKYKIDLIMDANYPAKVKLKIAELANFRQDLMYVRDFGLGNKTIEEILAVNDDFTPRSMFIMDEHLNYDILDPYTKKPIPVTVCYSLTRLFIRHFAGGRHRPLAGQKYGFILSDALEGTVNFVPKVTPEHNQKEQLADQHINYASYYDDELVMETFWTSQENLTNMSFANNVLSTQEVIKAIRTRCPSIRYSFIDGDDLEKYKEDVNEVIDKYSNNFYKIRFTYLQDETMRINKTFYAAIEVIHRDFNMAEKFKVYILRKEA